MPSNHNGWQVHYWQGRYGGLGQLFSPGRSWKPHDHLPYALDNGAYGAFIHQRAWDAKAFVTHCDRIKNVGIKPLWLIVPDVVADARATLERWEDWEPRLRNYRVPLAFAVQDGHVLSDVPRTANVVFVGGSTAWKQANFARFCDQFERVHVGRVNTWKWLWYCHDAGAESVDGTGWFRDPKDTSKALELYLQTCAGERPRAYQLQLFGGK